METQTEEATHLCLAALAIYDNAFCNLWTLTSLAAKDWPSEARKDPFLALWTSPCLTLGQNNSDKLLSAYMGI